jgi:hypothetical protein
MKPEGLLMVTFNEMRIQKIVEEKDMPIDVKIQELREIETEARGLQRAASESQMNANDGWDADLREVRRALDKLGAKKATQKSGATL